MSLSQHPRKKYRGKAPLRPVRKADTYLPEELWIHILSLLPVKNLLVLRSVSKLFHSVIDDSDFISLHLSRFPGNLKDASGLLVSLGHPKCDPENCNRPVYCQLREIDGPLTTNFVTGFHLLTSAKNLSSTPLDGFVVLMARDDRLGLDVAMLWNPSIRKTRTLPPISPSFFLTSSTAIYFGIGYDPSCKDYKVLAVVKELKTDDHDDEKPMVWVYSLRNHAWTPVHNSSYSVLVCPGPGPSTRDTNCCDSVSYQGRLFWTEKWRSQHDFRPTNFLLRLVCFDFVTEKLCYCKLPTSWGSLNLLKASSGCGESFIGWQSRGEYYGSIWALETETMSWTKRYRCDEAYLHVKYVTSNPAMKGYPDLTNEGFRMNFLHNVESLVLLI